MGQTGPEAEAQQSQHQSSQPPSHTQPPANHEKEREPETAAAAAAEEGQEPSLSALSSSAQLDLAVSLILNSWPALTLAVQSSWGGPMSSDKRDWLCGAIADMFSSHPDTDAQDLEEVLLQVMNDEFDVVVDDGSAADTAVRMCQVRADIAKGRVGRLKELWDAWKANKGGKEVRDMFKRVEAGEGDQETDSEWEDDDDDDDEEKDGDVDMEDVSAVPRQQRERIEPEVDDEGFTKVVGRKKR